MGRFVDYGDRKLMGSCVYTIVSRDVLDERSATRKPLTRKLHMRWATAKAVFGEARQQSASLAIVIADAKACSRLLYWGVLDDVSVRGEHTSYTVGRLRPISGSHAPQDLILRSTGKPIAPGFIKAYAICETPGFLLDTPSEADDAVFVSPEECRSTEALIEGATTRISVNSFERSVEARRRCLDHYGCQCSVCGLDFEERYGSVGAGFIHVHHLKLLSGVTAAYEVSPVRDLRPVCPNCHAMIHRATPPFTIDRLKRRMNAPVRDRNARSNRRSR